jgi:tRNA(Ser,Leu) C12 N-acetylase TAN1
MEWNVVVSIKDHGLKEVRKFLSGYGKLKLTDYYNVMVMQVDDVDQFLEAMHAELQMHRHVFDYVGRVVPVSHRFLFQSPDEFEKKAKEVVAQWLDNLAGKHFHVRLHRRGFRGRLSSQHEEHFLDDFIIMQLESNGIAPATIDFDNPDTIIVIETVGQQAGLSLWTSEQLERYPFLKLN